MNVIPAYGVQCLVAGCWVSDAGQQAMRPRSGMMHDCSRAKSLFLYAYPAALYLIPDNQQQSTAHHRR